MLQAAIGRAAPQFQPVQVYDVGGARACAAGHPARVLNEVAGTPASANPAHSRSRTGWRQPGAARQHGSVRSRRSGGMVAREVPTRRSALGRLRAFQARRRDRRACRRADQARGGSGVSSSSLSSPFFLGSTASSSSFFFGGRPKVFSRLASLRSPSSTSRLTVSLGNLPSSPRSPAVDAGQDRDALVHGAHGVDVELAVGDRLDDILAQHQAVDVAFRDDDALRAGQPLLLADVEEALDLVRCAADGLDLAVLVDRAGDGDALA